MPAKDRCVCRRKRWPHEGIILTVWREVQVAAFELRPQNFALSPPHLNSCPSRSHFHGRFVTHCVTGFRSPFVGSALWACLWLSRSSSLLVLANPQVLPPPQIQLNSVLSTIHYLPSFSRTLLNAGAPGSHWLTIVTALPGISLKLKDLANGNYGETPLSDIMAGAMALFLFLNRSPKLLPDNPYASVAQLALWALLKSMSIQFLFPTHVDGHWESYK
jgi:hypothetical protein